MFVYMQTDVATFLQRKPCIFNMSATAKFNTASSRNLLHQCIPFPSIKWYNVASASGDKGEEQLAL